MIEVRPLTDQSALAELISRQPYQPFLQSWAWGEFQHAYGRRIWRLGAYDENRLVGAMTIIEHRLMLGKTYFYVPRGPLADNPEVLAGLLTALRDLGAQKNAMYVKIDPGLYNWPIELNKISQGYELGTTLQPKYTIILNIDRSLDDIINSMHQKTRYNIRLAEKKGVNVRWGRSDQDFDEFIKLMKITAARQDIKLHSNDYYRKLFTILGQAGMAELVVGEYDGAMRAAHLIVWHGQTATYLHGGSDDVHREAMIPYLLQWETIKKCHARGVKNYDLWGVAPPGNTRHHWAGITRFKLGFAGQPIEFPTALNAIIQPQWYQAYRLAKRIRGGIVE